MMRTNPKGYIPYLQDMLKRFDGKLYKAPGIGIMTNEGAAVVNELIGVLNSQPALHPMRWSEPLARAARVMVAEQGPTGGLGHDGPSGSTMSSRISD